MKLCKCTIRGSQAHNPLKMEEEEEETSSVVSVPGGVRPGTHPLHTAWVLWFDTPSAGTWVTVGGSVEGRPRCTWRAGPAFVRCTSLVRVDR
jgi:hypothetical protein